MPHACSLDHLEAKERLEGGQKAEKLAGLLVPQHQGGYQCCSSCPQSNLLLMWKLAGAAAQVKLLSAQATSI
eukprot:2541042-Pleurochrysis_carterae.AAC.1